ncbi:MAG: cysteine desulfurase, partial [Enterococcus aquimarinus]
MAFQQKATVLGSDVFYRIAPQAKRYTLRDNG